MDASKWLGLAALVLGVLGSYWNGKVISSWLTGETLTLTKEARQTCEQSEPSGLALYRGRVRVRGAFDAARIARPGTRLAGHRSHRRRDPHRRSCPRRVIRSPRLPAAWALAKGASRWKTTSFA